MPEIPGTNAYYSIDEMIESARADLARRRRVYAAKLRDHEITAVAANHAIQIQRVTVITLEQVKAMHWTKVSA